MFLPFYKRFHRSTYKDFLVKTIIVLMCLIIFTGLGSLCQPRTIVKPVYTISFLPRKANYDPVKLNDAISSAKTREEVRNVIYKRHLDNCIVTILEAKPAAPLVWWFINLGDKTESFKDFVILRSRGITEKVVTRLGGFRELIKDTMLLLDTMSIAVRLNDPGYRDSGFGFELNCNGQTSVVASLPGGNKNLLLYPALINCKDGYEELVLFSKYNRERKLATAVITTLDSEKELLVEAIGADFLKNNPGVSSQDVEDFIEAVLIKLFGVPQRESLHKWLARSNLQKL